MLIIKGRVTRVRKREYRDSHLCKVGGNWLGSIWKGRVTWVREGHDLCGGAYGWEWAGLNMEGKGHMGKRRA